MGIKSIFASVGVLTVSLLMPTGVNAALLHESATLGPTGVNNGESLDTDVNIAIGSRFTISDTTIVDSVGGHMYVNWGDLFAAIIVLDNSTSLPTGAPYDLSNVIASTVFTGTFPSSDMRVPLSATLVPGDYALIFGSFGYGAYGSGAMTKNNTDISGSASYFIWDELNDVWIDGGYTNYDGFTNLRFVVTGSVVPIPAAVWLFGSGLIGLVGLARRKAQI